MLSIYTRHKYVLNFFIAISLLSIPVKANSQSMPMGPTTVVMPTPTTTVFAIHKRSYIEGSQINCPAFAAQFFPNLINVGMATAFCVSTVISFPETSATTPARLNQSYGITVTCMGSMLRTMTTTGPVCSMGTESLGNALTGTLYVGTGVEGACHLAAVKPIWQAHLKGAPAQHLNIGIFIVKPRVCKNIQIGISMGTVGCNNDGVGTFNADVYGSTFPSHHWSVTRTKPDGSIDDDTETASQPNLMALWNCNDGADVPIQPLGKLVLN